MHNRKKKNNQKTTTYKKAITKTKGKKSKTKKDGDSFPLFRFLGSERMTQVYGVVFMAFAVFLFISIFSHIFTHESDLGFIHKLPDMNNPENIGGKPGAYLAYYFTHYLFGIFSIGFSLIFFLIGLRLTFDKTPLRILKTSITTILTMAWLSMVAGFFVYDSAGLFVAGYFGVFTGEALWLSTGPLVAVLIAVIAFLAIGIICYNLSIKSLGNGIAKTSIAIGGSFMWVFNKIKEQKTKRETNPKPRKTKKKRTDADLDTDLSDLYITNRNELQDEYDVNKVHFDLDDPAEMPLKPELEDEGVPFDIRNDLGSNLPDEFTEENEDNEGDEGDAENGESEEGMLFLEDYDPRADLSTYQLPGETLLKDYSVKEVDTAVMRAELVENKNKIETTLKHFNIQIKSISATVGPTVTLYEIVPAEGIRISKIKNLEDDIALNLAALGIRIIAPIPGKGTIGIEVPNKNPRIVSMREIIESDKFKNNKYDLPIGLGKTISNESFVVDLAKMPHMLMAGATGQGKSVGLNAIIASLLYTKHPSELKFVMIDPKKVEFSLYSVIENYYLAKLPDMEEPIITDTKKVIRTLKSLCEEMDERYDLLKAAKTRNIKEYNAKFRARQLNPLNGHRFLPYIVLLIDEFGDLIMTAGREVEMPIARLAQLARAIGIHLIIATQRPSVNIITGTIKANFPARIAFRVSSKIDSRTILDGNGADQLIGKGDMLISTGSDLIRLQCAFVDTPEVENIVRHIESQQAYPSAFLLPDVPEDSKGGRDDDDDSAGSDNIDDFFMDAASLIVQAQQGSTSLIQRKLSLGYNRAGRIMDQLEKYKIVGPAKGSKAREVLVKTNDELREIFVRLGIL
ncbi:DNA translocase FtsK [Bacteroidales bacterium OttesenSCG-928-B11]|nr:DNA translocase FtsK [Bacteroidales bacterium OttesenSCG-928-B11]MDL2326365.1 DNA translocase FtsK [Bacteroidales bacterium OttesenSCG-928-A14]